MTNTVQSQGSTQKKDIPVKKYADDKGACGTDTSCGTMKNDADTPVRGKDVQGKEKDAIRKQ